MKVKKIITITSIASIGLSALIGILLVLGILKLDLDGALFQVLLTLLILGIGSLVSINSVNLLEKSFSIPALVSLVLIGLSCLLALIWAWFKIEWGFFTQLTLVLVVFSVLFNFIVSYIIKLGKAKLPYQIVTYSLMAIFDIFITIQIFNSSFLDNDVIVKIFIVDIILALVGMALLAIFSKKSLTSNDAEFIKISKSEYDGLKKRIEELENELKIKNQA